MTRQANKREIAWCNRLKRLMEKMPPKMILFAAGDLHAVDKKEYLNYGECDHLDWLGGIGYIGFCDGGDP